MRALREAGGLSILAAAILAAGCGGELTASDAARFQGPRSFTLTYEFAATDLPADAPVRMWVPVPQDTALQDVSGLEVDLDLPYEVVRDEEYGNEFVYVQAAPEDLDDRDTISGRLTVRVTRRPVSPGGEATPAARDHVPTPLERFLEPDLLVPIDGKIAEEARAIAGGVRDPLQRARRLYDHVVTSMSYDKSGEGWGRGDAGYACDVRKGNCTDFHSLFIGEARSLGIPARFVMGLPLPPSQIDGEIGGYHCWGEFYVEGRGWLPVDASEASKHPDKKESLFTGIDEHRVQFTVGRDIELPGSSAGPVNFSVYPHVEVAGRWHGGVDRKFLFVDDPS